MNTSIFQIIERITKISYWNERMCLIEQMWMVTVWTFQNGRVDRRLFAKWHSRIVKWICIWTNWHIAVRHYNFVTTEYTLWDEKTTTQAVCFDGCIMRKFSYKCSTTWGKMLRYRPCKSRPVSCIHEMLKTTTVRLLHADLSMLSFKESPYCHAVRYLHELIAWEVKMRTIYRSIW